ncbi:DUF3189 family protein [Evansella halocellulosilytica]|uniref:DUF3189 family protein n=1 Tax=Evansella halocellulosilytica TaxID=2011013 RepID=UPI000BB8BA79|nr:DUF3189 family protein [Evansella halocellulosilytica]
MIYIYNCYGGTHSSVLAAAYHLQSIPTDRIPTKEEILAIDIFNRLKTKDMGKIYFHGHDENGHAVYTVGRGSSKALVPALKNLIELLEKHGENHDQVILSNTSPTVPPAMTFGGLFSRRLHIDWIGVPLLIRGAQQTYPNTKKLVGKTKRIAISTNQRVKVLDNKELEVNKWFG